MLSVSVMLAISVFSFADETAAPAESAPYDEDYSGFADADGGRYRISSGSIDKTYSAVVYENGEWRYYVKGAWQKNYTGIADVSNEYGWWYIKKGTVDFGFTGFEDNKNGRFRVDEGKVNFYYNAVVYEGSQWRYYVNGAWQKNYTGISDIPNEYGWWYVKKGTVDFGFTGFANNKNGRFRVDEGKVNFRYNDITYESSEWRYYVNGAWQTSYCGVSAFENKYGYWYIQNGVVDMTYTGPWYQDGLNVLIKEGHSYKIVSSAEASMSAKAQNYSSNTDYIILVNRSTHKLGLYEKKTGGWDEMLYVSCGDGAPSTPTIEGVFRILNKAYYFDSDNVRCFYACRFDTSGYWLHTILYAQTSSPKYVQDGRLGVAVSHGCVRLATDVAKYIYYNIPVGTAVVVYH